MAFCKNCGNPIADGSTFCPNCGTPVDNAQQTYQQEAPQQSYEQPYQQEAPQQSYEQPYQQPVQPQVMNPDGSPLPGEKGLAWLAYVLLAPAFLVPMFVKKTSEYCKFHVKQGATLWAVHMAYYILQSIIGDIIHSAAVANPYNGAVVGINVSLSILFAAGHVFLSVLAIIGIINAATGKKKELPLIDKIPWVAMLIDKIYGAINK